MAWILQYLLSKPHRYLGRSIICSANRCSIEISNRIRLALGKFAQHHKWLANRQVLLHLILKVFDCIVSPIRLFAICLGFWLQFSSTLNTKPQKKMLRSIGSYVRVSDEPWSDTMQRMKHRINHAATMHLANISLYDFFAISCDLLIIFLLSTSHFGIVLFSIRFIISLMNSGLQFLLLSC